MTNRKSIFQVVLVVVLFMATSIGANAQTANLIVGTYTQKGSKGIYLFQFDTATGKSIELSHTDNISNPSFLAITKDKQFVYAVNENTQGGLSAFSLSNNKLKLINQVATNGADPCYISISKDQKNILVANYSGGSVAQFYKFADGRVSNVRQLIQHSGSSINKARQEKAHVHGSFFSPDGNYLLTPDLGMDQVAIYPFQSKNTPPLNTTKAKYIQAEAGSGPRHLSFSKNGNTIYLVEELTGSVAVYKFKDGTAILTQTVKTHPANFNGAPGSADIHVSPNGQFLYVSNRGEENNIVKFPILPNGKLVTEKAMYFSTQGNSPRNFTISEDGKWLLVANQNTDNIVVFKVNETNGDLINTGNTIKVSMPVCLVLF